MSVRVALCNLFSPFHESGKAGFINETDPLQAERTGLCVLG